MLEDVRTVLWKEWRELLPRSGATRSTLVALLFMPLFFGVLLPARVGETWLTSWPVLFAVVVVPNATVAGVVADAFAGERERHTLETLLASRLPDRAILFGKLLAAVGYGWAITLVTLLLGAITANLQGSSGVRFYSGDIFAGAVLLSLLMAVLTAGVGVLISLRAATVRQAQQLVSLTVVIPAILPSLFLTALSAEQRRDLLRAVSQASVLQIVLLVAAALAAVDAALLVAATRRFHRSRLVIET